MKRFLIEFRKCYDNTKPKPDVLLQDKTLSAE